MKNQLHPEPDYLSNDIKRTRRIDQPTLMAAIVMAVLIFLSVSFSRAAEKLPRGVQCTSISKSTQKQCTRITRNASKICFQHEKVQAKKGGAVK